MKYVFKKNLLKVLVSAIDFLGAVISFPFKAFNPPKLPGKISRVLLIRLDHVGDVIMSTAALKALKEALPGAKIDFLAPSWGIDFIKNNPYVDRVIEFDPVWFDRKSAAGILDQIKNVMTLRKIAESGGYDAAIDLRGDFRHILSLFLSGIKCRISYGITGGGFLLTHEAPYRPGMHEIEHNMELVRILGKPQGKPKIELVLSNDTGKKAAEVLKENGVPETYAVFHIVPGHATKVWNDANFLKVIDYVNNKKNLPVVLVGAAEDRKVTGNITSRERKNIYDLSGKTDWEELAGVIKKSSFFIGVDSAPAHIAASLGAPTAILFSGVNDPAQWAPKGENVRIIYPGRGRGLSEVKPEEVCRVIDEMIA